MESENENINMMYGSTFYLKLLLYKSLLNHSKIPSSNYALVCVWYEFSKLSF